MKLIFCHVWSSIYSQGCQIGKKLNIIRFFRFKMRAKFTVADESSRKFIVPRESDVFVAI